MIIVLRKLGLFLVGVVLLVLTAWATAALYFDFPFAPLRIPLAITYIIVALVGAVFLRSRRVAILLGGFCLVCGWWFTLKPSNARAWQSDVAETAWAEIKGDEVVLHNVRNCDYVTELNYTPHWEARTVRLSQLAGVDITLIYWGSPWIASPIAPSGTSPFLPPRRGARPTR